MGLHQMDHWRNPDALEKMRKAKISEVPKTEMDKAEEVVNAPGNELLKANSDKRESDIGREAAQVDARRYGNGDLSGHDREYIDYSEYAKLGQEDAKQLVATRRYIENVEYGNVKGEMTEKEYAWEKYVLQQIERYQNNAKLDGEEKELVRQEMAKRGIKDSRSPYRDR